VEIPNLNWSFNFGDDHKFKEQGKVKLDNLRIYLLSILDNNLKNSKIL